MVTEVTVTEPGDTGTRPTRHTAQGQRVQGHTAPGAHAPHGTAPQASAHAHTGRRRTSSAARAHAPHGTAQHHAPGAHAHHAPAQRHAHAQWPHAPAQHQASAARTTRAPHGATAQHTGRRNGATSNHATRYLDCRMAQRRITTRDGATCSRSQRVGVAPTRVQGGKAVCQESAHTRRKMRANAKESTENLRVFAPFQIGLGMVSERSLTIQNGRKVARSRKH
jgi:hypothetical protein